MVSPRIAIALAALGLGACATPRASVRCATPERGGTEFEYRGEAFTVSVTGTMTDWRAAPLQRSGERWTVRLPIRPGRYEYRLEVMQRTGMQVVLPEGVERVDDGFGGQNAVLRVLGTTERR